MYRNTVNPDLPGLLGIELRPGKLRDPVNRGMVNRGFTVPLIFPKTACALEQVQNYDLTNYPGVIVLDQEHTVCTAGKALTTQQAVILVCSLNNILLTGFSTASEIFDFLKIS